MNFYTAKFNEEYSVLFLIYPFSVFGATDHLIFLLFLTVSLAFKHALSLVCLLHSECLSLASVVDDLFFHRLV